MRRKYLVDTNILIYHTNGIEKATSFIAKLIKYENLNISVITKIEFLGWNQHTSEGYSKCKKLMELCNIIYIDDDTAEIAIDIKRYGKIRLGDALIAATAIKNGLSLVTNNISDFEKLKDLSIHNPF